jgi:hypothetical protein
MYSGKIAVPPGGGGIGVKKIINLGREILLLGSIRDSIMTPSKTSSEKKVLNIQIKVVGAECFIAITYLAML